ncbi:RNA polymerase sigma factor [Mucilaginibacter sp. L3T2-6]|uniref:RNA polymerase sigma factor n=1 Tax=Mucilaginibacter sp. L3T2-6 TaxID=3062491 RepID=UPI0026747E1E|nr:hypothetical protein [Mucilaginibacter sp. L3T2-6]MDO3645261.1 hypothetical protein [Mucilaginibacter sp. L3T2-6]MDV6217713.1 hypothetical protein [Mucilaginibacter sp. L3T2-6]
MGSTVFKAAMFSDADLVQLVRIKSRAGMTMIYDAYARALFLAIFRILPIQEEAEEILEQTFLQIYRSVETFPIRDESFFT